MFLILILRRAPNRQGAGRIANEDSLYYEGRGGEMRRAEYSTLPAAGSRRFCDTRLIRSSAPERKNLSIGEAFPLISPASDWP
jgi:hypothetical protein